MAAGSCSGEDQGTGKMSTHKKKRKKKPAGRLKGWYKKGTVFDYD